MIVDEEKRAGFGVPMVCRKKKLILHSGPPPPECPHSSRMQIGMILWAKTCQTAKTIQFNVAEGNHCLLFAGGSKLTSLVVDRDPLVVRGGTQNPNQDTLLAHAGGSHGLKQNRKSLEANKMNRKQVADWPPLVGVLACARSNWGTGWEAMAAEHKAGGLDLTAAQA